MKVLILEDEKPGILNWILEGVERLLVNQRFTESGESEMALTEYKNESNSVISSSLDLPVLIFLINSYNWA